MTKAFDAIVVGARCAGSPTAMLLARQGYRVLMVDRATFPSDTVSTHIVHPLGVSALSRWGLLDRLTELAAELEAGAAASLYRFGATRAYDELVGLRRGGPRGRAGPRGANGGGVR